MAIGDNDMTDDKLGGGAKQLESVNAVRAFQRNWLEKTRERVVLGEPFAICNGDEFEDIFNMMDIPVIVINYWNSIIAQKRMGVHYNNVLATNGYPKSEGFFAWGLASTLDNNPETAPWGGLPKPAIIIGGSKSDLEMKVLDIWAREMGCPFFPLDFSFDSFENIIEGLYPPPADAMNRMRNHWDEIIKAERLDMRVEEEKALIHFIEVTTGRRLSNSKVMNGLMLLNEQMDYWVKARDLIAETIPCPVGVRDQSAMYQAMWHRGSTTGRDLVKAYYEEVKERVEKGIAASPNERLRLSWSGDRSPIFNRYLEQKYGAVIVAWAYSSFPDRYYRNFTNKDPMRCLAALHMVLGWAPHDKALQDAVAHKCDGAIRISFDNRDPTVEGSVWEENGIPLCEIPRDSDDAEVISILDKFMERLLSRKGKNY
jgi:hypothetical protein